MPDGAVVFTREALAHAADVLGLPGDLKFTEAEVVAGWRRMMQRVHPDVGGNDHFAREVNRARELLAAWIAAGRPSPVETAEEQAARRPPPQPDANRSGPTPRGRLLSRSWRLVSGVARYGFGLIVLISVVKVGYNIVVYRDSEGANDWTEVSESEASGVVVHGLTKRLDSDAGLYARLFIGCPVSGVGPAPFVKVSIIPAKDQQVMEVSAMRAAAPDTLKTGIADDRSFADLAVVKSVETLTGSEAMNAFGAAGLVILGRWAIQGDAGAPTDRDVTNVLHGYYDPVFSNQDLRIDVSLKDAKGLHRIQSTYKFADLGSLRHKLFTDCHLTDPYQ